MSGLFWREPVSKVRQWGNHQLGKMTWGMPWGKTLNFGHWSLAPVFGVYSSSRLHHRDLFFSSTSPFRVEKFLEAVSRCNWDELSVKKTDVCNFYCSPTKDLNAPWSDEPHNSPLNTVSNQLKCTISRLDNSPWYANWTTKNPLPVGFPLKNRAPKYGSWCARSDPRTDRGWISIAPNALYHSHEANGDHWRERIYLSGAVEQEYKITNTLKKRETQLMGHWNNFLISQPLFVSFFFSPCTLPSPTQQKTNKGKGLTEVMGPLHPRKLSSPYKLNPHFLTRNTLKSISKSHESLC